MNLRDRNLSIEMQGGDVKLLQSELRQLGFDFPDNEMQEAFFGEGTRAAVLSFQETHQLEPTGVVDERMARVINALVDALPPEPEPDEPAPLIVRGEAHQANGSPLTGALVRAFDKDMRSEELLGETTTDQTGSYEIAYTADQFRRAEKQSADLRVCLYNDAGREIVSSPIIFNAQPVEQVNLSVGGEYRGPSEYEDLVGDLTPLLQDVPLRELTTEDVTFLTGDTGQDPQRIAWLAEGDKLAHETGIPAEAFYGWFRQNLPVSLPAFFSQSPDVLRRAMEIALRDNVIPARLRDEMGTIFDRLPALMVEQMLQPADGQDRASLGELLSIALPNREKQQAVADAFVRHQGPVEELWKELREDSEFGEEETGQLQATLQLGMLTGNHLPLVRELQEMGRDDETLRELQGFTKFDEAGWGEILRRPQENGQPIGFPPGVPGGSDDETIENYANLLARLIEDAFPTAAIVHRLEKDEGNDNPFEQTKDDLKTFFRDNPTFEFGTTIIDEYLNEDATVLSGVTSEPALTQQLKSMQRVFKVTPRYEEMRALLADGLYSAQAITRIGQNAFVERYATVLGGSARAESVYAKAQHNSAMALTLFARHSAALNSVEPYAISGGPTASASSSSSAASGTPGLRTLFGSIDFCDCEHCRSVYSPAAYLVDSLKFLNEGPKKSNKTPLQVLSGRRPDIEHIELTCENTNRPLPYVDLVNEVLENAVSPFAPFTPFTISATLESDLENRNLTPGLRNAFAPPLSESAVIVVEARGKRWSIIDTAYAYGIKEDASTLKVVSRSLQTRGTPQELSANPQYLNSGAYDTLAAAVYPWTLPLNLWVEEARVYLGHLGVQRHEVMETSFNGTPSAALNDVAIAREYLGLTTTDAGIITGSITHDTRPIVIGQPADRPWDFWGFLENVAIPDPADSSKTVSGKWDAVLKRVDVFLQRSGLSYEELLELLGAYFVNPVKSGGARTLSVVSTDANDPATCNLSKLEIQGLDATALGKIHRFVRLWRALGWTVRDLDKTITALQPEDQNGALSLTESFLIELSHIERLRADLNVPLVKMLGWWAKIDAASYTDHLAEAQPEVPSLYVQLFRNKTIVNPLDADFTEDPGALGGNIKDHEPSITAALGISAADLSLLLDGPVGDTLNLENLSLLYRITSLARALKLSIREFLSVKALMAKDPFTADTTTTPVTTATQATLRFVKDVGTIRASGFSIVELDYLLRHEYTPPTGVAPADEEAALLLAEIRDGLQKIQADDIFAPDPTGETTRTKLTILLDDEKLAHALSLIDGSSQEPGAAKAKFVDDHLKLFPDISEAKAKLVGSASNSYVPSITKTEERFDYVLEELLGYLRRTFSENFVTQKLSEALKLETAVASQLLSAIKYTSGTTEREALLAFRDMPIQDGSGNDLTGKVERDGYGDQFDTFTVLQKAATMVSRLKITSAELEWLLTKGPATGRLALTNLPFDASQSVSFASWQYLVDMARLRDSVPAGEPALLDLLDKVVEVSPTAAPAVKNGVKQELLEGLSELTTWFVEDLEFLFGKKDDYTQTGLFNVTFPNDFKNERMLARLQVCSRMMKLVRRLGVSAKQLDDWSKADPSSDDASSIKNSVKAKYEDEKWLAVTRPLRDMLREKQRAGLVSLLVNKRGVRDANELYDDFLIDVEMSPCQMTSRIKQAISSAQLFVQRCLMNLEPEVALSPEDSRRWQWMKNYRVWEANRKVFLYPENWIEPELRDDKSLFFKDLENELLQNDITMDTAETAFLHYLEKLDEVARLEVCGMYHQRDKDTDILHVLARTFSDPRIYYYRQRVNSTIWTAWERVDVDIEGDHVIPVVWNRRLFLFWVIFSEKSYEGLALGPGSTIPANPRPATKLEIQLAWSEYKNKRWVAKKVSGEKISVPPSPQWIYNGITEILLYAPVEKTNIVFKSRIDTNGDLVITFRYRREGAQDEHDASRPATSGMWWYDFRLTGCDGTVATSWTGFDSVKKELTPQNTHVESMAFIANEAQQGLSFISAGPMLGKNARTLKPFRIAYQHQFWDFTAQAPFFYQDDIRTFLVSPREESAPGLDKPDQISLTEVHKFDYGYALKQLEKHQVFELSDLSNFSDPHGPPKPTLSDGMTEAPGPAPLPDGIGSVSFAMGTETALPGTETASRSGMTTPYDTLAELITRYLFEPFYHPYVCEFMKQLNRYGIDGLLDPKPDGPAPQLRRQMISNNEFFEADYEPSKRTVASPYPEDSVNFAYGGSYSTYNWELFFHAPLLIADRLNENQRFEEAQKWFHYIFDPTSSEPGGPERFWKVKPFYDAAKSKKILTLQELMGEAAELSTQVDQWREHPFKPHVIARLRVVAYMKTVVMKYIDNLVAWGDQLFRRDTIESINEATQLYVLAAQILGKRPEEIPARAEAEIQTFNLLNKLQPSGKPLLDDFSNALVQIENFVPPAGVPTTGTGNQQPALLMPYFCIPRNDRLLGYWDTVADRLFKIRHCMNIEGVVRQLPLFEPPIDPALLVKAAAAGVDISSALSDINAALPHYRFSVMLQKATELVDDVRSLGTAFLSALEKRDAEALALLRSGHEIQLLDEVRQVKEQQVEEAKRALEGLVQNQDATRIRHDYYANIAYMIPQETAHLTNTEAASLLRGEGVLYQRLAQGATIIPNFNFGASGVASPVVTAALGGPALAAGLTAMALAKAETGAQYNDFATRSQVIGSYVRRAADWDLQKRLAAKELEQIDKQILAAEIRLAIAERDLQNHDLQVENAREVDAYMRDKYTNQELYDWMVSQISTIYFQSYQLAYDVAKRAERAYRFELGLQDSSFIQFGYWDSLKKGLLAGERLHHDLKRMEIAYLDQNRREYELTKHISLAMLDPIKLVELRETGECYVELPEVVFDLDNPGHYMRRIRSVGLSIPCVTGPYTGVNCKLTLLRNSVRKDTSTDGGYARKPGEDVRFRDSIGAIQSVVTSSAREDHGVFEPSLRDERYQPFEGAGAISSWRIELDKDCNGFDFDTISDVVLHMAYTAREGGESLKNAAKAQVPQAGLQMFSARHEFPSEWHRFLHPTNTDAKQTLRLKLAPARFPFQFREKTIEIEQVDLFMKLSNEEVEKKYRGDGTGNVTSAPLTVYLRAPGASSAKDAKLESDDDFLSGVAYATVGVTHKAKSTDTPWEIEARSVDIEKMNDDLHDSTTVDGTIIYRLKPDVVEDLLVVCHYSVVHST